VFTLPAAVVLGLLVAFLTLPRAGSVAKAAESLPVCGTSDVEFIGFSDALNKTSYRGTAIVELSGLSYDAERGVYYVIADRSASGPARVFTLSARVNNDKLETPSIIGMAVLSNTPDAPYTGQNFDGEGIAFPGGVTMFVSSEGGGGPGQQPAIEQFSLYGGHLGSLKVPVNLQIGGNNLSFEGLALSPSGRSLFVSMEGPIPTDGLTSDNRGRIRIQRYRQDDLGVFQPAEQYFYLTAPGRDATELGVSELIALSDSELLVLERGFVAGKGNTVRIFRASLVNADDVSRAITLNNPSLRPLTKSLFLDLAACPTSGATQQPGAVQANDLLDNFEGMALGPDLGQGRRLMLLVSDDNSGSTQTTRLVALAVRLGN
jgi:hypothetical protein